MGVAEQNSGGTQMLGRWGEDDGRGEALSDEGEEEEERSYIQNRAMASSKNRHSYTTTGVMEWQIACSKPWPP